MPRGFELTALEFFRTSLFFEEVLEELSSACSTSVRRRRSPSYARETQLNLFRLALAQSWS